MLWMPLEVLYAMSLGEGLLGWISISNRGEGMSAFILEGRGDGKRNSRLTAGTTLQVGSLSRISKFLIPKFETPMARTLSFGNFCISSHVLTKFQSG